jgi:feruloyl esterase
LAAAVCGVAIFATGAAKAAANCADLTAVSLPHATVTAAAVQPVGSLQVCRAQVTSRPTADSDIRIEVWIPLGAAWNGKFVQVGNGGFAGAIPQPLMMLMASRGYAVAGTDDGHQSKAGTDASWGRGHPEKVVDFGWRALKETTDVGKALTVAMAGSPLKRAYFFGCSDGGREALMEAQRYPDDFDGIVAGAPANNFTRLLSLAVQIQQDLHRTPDAYLTAASLGALQAGALKDCGGGAFVRDPAACRFDPATTICASGQATEGCLTTAQAATAARIYAGLRDPRTGKILFPGFTPGAEALAGAWSAWITGPSADKGGSALSSLFGGGFFRDLVSADGTFDLATFDLSAGMEAAQARFAPILDSVDPNLAPFRAHGGKLLQFHGWNDPAIPARSSIVYYEDVRGRIGPVDDFYRLYLVPGMLHCGGGVSPANADWLSTLDAWVGGAAPARIVADAGSAFRPAAPGSPTQLLCPYPAVARYVAGPAEAAASYRCEGPPPRRS